MRQGLHLLQRRLAVSSSAAAKSLIFSASILLVVPDLELLIVMALSWILCSSAYTAYAVLGPAARLGLVLTEVDWSSSLLERTHVRLAEDRRVVIMS